jgi:S1-C subfamily serine protease
VLRFLNGLPIHSIADAQFALDRAPAAGKINLTWERAGKETAGSITLTEGWRKSDLNWRPSSRLLVPRMPLYGADLSAAQKQALGLPARQLALGLDKEINPRVQAAGVRPGVTVLGVDGKPRRALTASDFRAYVHDEYLIGDRVQIDVLRDGKRLSIPYILVPLR